MNVLLVVGIIIVISLLVIIFTINSKKENTKKSGKNKNKTSSLIVNDIMLPKKIRQMDQYTLSKAAKHVFESFKSLDYASKSPSKLDKVEWHTWQVSLLLAMIKSNKGFFVPDNDSFFHEVILTDKSSLIQSTQKIIDKFNSNINVNRSRDELSHDISWSSKEVSILFYYMSKY